MLFAHLNLVCKRESFSPIAQLSIAQLSKIFEFCAENLLMIENVSTQLTVFQEAEIGGRVYGLFKIQHTLYWNIKWLNDLMDG